MKTVGPWGPASQRLRALFVRGCLLVLASWTPPCGPHATEAEALHAIESKVACSALESPSGVNPAAGEGDVFFTTPPNAGGATLVDLGLFIMDITHISEVDNTFRMQGYMDLVWCDPRLAFDPEAAGSDEEVFLEENAVQWINRTWWPDLDFVNQTGPREIENQVLVVRSDGTVDYQEQFVAILKSPFDLRRFPFDRQVLEVEIESFVWSASALAFHEETGKIGFSERFAMHEWRIENVQSSVAARQEVRDRAPFSEFVLQIEVARKPGYYIWKLALPLFLLVLASWIVFWLTDWLVNRRLGLAFRGVLIVVAFQFVISGSLPRVPYLTLMDGFLTFSFAMMVLTILENTVVSHYYLKERQDEANRIDRVSRWFFPLLYASGIFCLLASYLL